MLINHKLEVLVGLLVALGNLQNYILFAGILKDNSISANPNTINVIRAFNLFYVQPLELISFYRVVCFINCYSLFQWNLG